MGLSDPTAVLDAITATVDELCACGCRQTLAGSVSAWFAGPDCQRRWQAARTDGELRDGGLLAGGVLPGWARDQAGPSGGTAEAGDAAARAEGNGRRRHRDLPLPAQYAAALLARSGAGREAQPDAGTHYAAPPDGQLVRLVVADQGLADEAHALWGRLLDQGRALLVRQDVAEAAERLGLPAGVVVAYDTTPLLDRVGEAFAGLRAGLEMYGEAVRAVMAGVGRTVEWLDEHRLLDPPGPAAAEMDPRERALAVRRNRNTGPARPVRAPRRIDPRGGAPRR